MMSATNLTIYIAGSFKHMHGVRLLGNELRRLGCEILDWTLKASPPPGLNIWERRQWMDTDQAGGQVYAFCRNACRDADLLIYYGASGQDAGVEVGLAAAFGVPVLGIRGPLEQPGLMLHGAITAWVDSAEDAIGAIQALGHHRSLNWLRLDSEQNLAVSHIGRAMLAKNAAAAVDAKPLQS